MGAEVSTLVAFFVFVGVLVTLVVAAAAMTWVEDRVAHGSLEHPCCPPGLGCNDPDETRRACRRGLAHRLADVSDGIALDNAWSAFNSTSRARMAKRRSELRRFAVQRDRVISVKLHEYAVAEHESKGQLPQYGQAVALIEQTAGEPVRGEVV